jgi:RhoGEF domain/PX domain
MAPPPPDVPPPSDSDSDSDFAVQDDSSEDDVFALDDSDGNVEYRHNDSDEPPEEFLARVDEIKRDQGVDLGASPASVLGSFLAEESERERKLSEAEPVAQVEQVPAVAAVAQVAPVPVAAVSVAPVAVAPVAVVTPTLSGPAAAWGAAPAPPPAATPPRVAASATPPPPAAAAAATVIVAKDDDEDEEEDDDDFEELPASSGAGPPPALPVRDMSAPALPQRYSAMPQPPIDPDAAPPAVPEREHTAGVAATASTPAPPGLMVASSGLLSPEVLAWWTEHSVRVRASICRDDMTVRGARSLARSVADMDEDDEVAARWARCTKLDDVVAMMRDAVDYEGAPDSVPAFVTSLYEHMKARERMLPDLASYDEAAVVECQRLARGYLARGELRRLRANDEQRFKVVRELIQTEQGYLDRIRTLIKVYMEPLLDASSPWGSFVPPATVQQIFSNIVAIDQYHQTLRAELGERFEVWSRTQKIGDVFVRMSPYLKLYMFYTNNYDQAMLALSAAKKKSSQMEKFIVAQREHPLCVDRLRLETLIIAPVQRIPRYILLLRDVLKVTEPEHPDYDDLRKAIADIQAIASELDERIQDAERSLLVLSVQSKLQGCPITLVGPSRRLLREDVVHIARLESSTLGGNSSDEMRFVLFNDALLCADKSYHFKALISFVHPATHIKDVRDNDMIQNAFYLISADHTYTVRCASAAEKQSWLDDIQDAIHDSQSRRATRIDEGADGSVKPRGQTFSLATTAASPRTAGSTMASVFGGGDDPLSSGAPSSSSSPADSSRARRVTVGAGAHISATIVGTEQVNARRYSEYTVYIIESSGEQRPTVQVRRRFREFVSLHRHFHQQYPSVRLSELPVRRAFGTLSSKTIEARRIMLERSLSEYLVKAEFAHDPMLYEFLTGSKE